jgi:hypothetical protein
MHYKQDPKWDNPICWETSLITNCRTKEWQKWCDSFEGLENVTLSSLSLMRANWSCCFRVKSMQKKRWGRIPKNVQVNNNVNNCKCKKVKITCSVILATIVQIKNSGSLGSDKNNKTIIKRKTIYYSRSHTRLKCWSHPLPDRQKVKQLCLCKQHVSQCKKKNAFIEIHGTVKNPPHKVDHLAKHRNLSCLRWKGFKTFV